MTVTGEYDLVVGTPAGASVGGEQIVGLTVGAFVGFTVGAFVGLTIVGLRVGAS